MSWVQNVHDAEEITQDVFLEVHASYMSFRGQSSVYTWIYRITIHKCMDHTRARNRKKRLAFLTSLFRDTGEVKHDQTDFIHPGIAIERQEDAALLFKVLDTLAPNQKSAFILTQVEELSYAEAAEILKLNVGAVESLVSRAKQNLRKKLENFYNDRRFS